MKRFLVCLLLAGLASGCSDINHPVDPDLSPDALKRGPAAAAKKAKAPVEKPFKMSRSDLELDWGIERDQEVACQIDLGAATSPADADHIAGGAISGNGNFTHLGRSTIEMSAAWDVGNLLTLDPDFEPQFEPVGPAGGPVAPVLGPGDYPYQFHVDPFSSPPPNLPPVCDLVVSATGNFLITAANGDEVMGNVVGGETHRLDFMDPLGNVVQGSGIETFAIVHITGGTGRFADASGSFVIHTITRFDFVALEFVIDLAEVLPGGTIAY